MDTAPDSYGSFWHYLSRAQKDLLLEGDYLINNVIKTGNYQFKDYSFHLKTLNQNTVARSGSISIALGNSS